MTYWPYWSGGIALAAVMVAHWLLSRRMMAVSSRYTSLVNAWRDPRGDEPSMSEAELVAALAAATREAYGSAAVGDAPAENARDLGPPAPPQQKPQTHLVFLVAVIGGGFVSFALGGGAAPEPALRSAGFTELFGAGVLAWLVLIMSGVLVGFGTRMASGCTTGHGLCGVSRFQPGSLLAMAAFFGSGIGLSFALEALR